MKRGPLNQILQDIVEHDRNTRDLAVLPVVHIDILRERRARRKGLVNRLLAKQPT